MQRLVLLALALTLPCAAQDSSQEPAGTAQISGRVISTETGQPIDKAQVAVSLSTADPPRWTRPVFTNADGRYEIDWLPAATFLVQATADGFVAQTYQHPEDPNPLTSPLIPVADAAAIPDINFSLANAGTLHGSVVELSGDPVGEGVSVSAVPDAKPYHAIMSAVTDATGHFELKRLAPGIYRLCVNGPDGAGASKANVTYRATWLGDTAIPDNSQTVEVHLGNPGPDLRIVAPRITGHNLIVTAVWPASESTRPDHFTAEATGNYHASQLPDGTLNIPNLPPGKYKLHVFALRGPDLLGQGDTDFTMPTTDSHTQVKVIPTPAP